MKLMLLIALLAQVVAGAFESYNPDTYPDSQREWALCRAAQPSFVCDPNQLLNPAADGTQGVEKVHRALERLRANSNCSCGQAGDYIPGSDPPRLGSTVGACDPHSPHGYTLSVAVLKKILVDEQYPRAIEEVVSVFANALRNRFSRGQCQDDAVIVFSVDDSAVWTSTGSNIARKLTPDFITSVSMNSQEFFANNDHTGALLFMINEYGRQLGVPPSLGEGVQELAETSWWEQNVWSRLPAAPWRWLVLLLLALLLVAIVGGLVYGAYRLISKARKHRDGYEMGRPQPVNR